MNLIVHSKDDTLSFELHFRYLDNVSTVERKIIYQLYISQADSILNHKNFDINAKSIIEQKANLKNGMLAIMNILS
jgi:hypothetical protein